jgi:ABC-type transport system involved in multi-copper enzyme maturation permease subunit
MSTDQRGSGSIINAGLVGRALREMLPTTLLCAALLATISGLLAYALPQFQARVIQRAMPPAFTQMRSVMLGVDATGSGVADVAFSIAWAHPVMLILLLTQCVIACTRVPAGEIERGSIDMLMGLPISRWQLFRSETTAWVIGGAIVLGAVYGGSFLGSRFILPEYRPTWGKLAMVLLNLSFVYAVAGAAAMAASAMSDRRGRAVLVVLVMFVGSLLVNFLELLWEPAKQIAFLSFLHYYRPIGMLMNGKWPLGDLAILGGIAAALWIFAGMAIGRRALTTL